VKAGARCATHLFNAMSQLGSREPGLVGAALSNGALSAGLIADGVHVHRASMAAALAAKAKPGRIFLVSDAMAVAGTDLDGFGLNDRRIERRDGRLTLPDGTLAGADLDLARAVRLLVHDLGLALPDAFAMATSVPADLAGQPTLGRIAPGGPADIIHLDDGLGLASVWQRGRPVTVASR
jgi:N-acetylglucosamine-6-phosphate deacetylase